ncbi:hypothetical protein [Luteibacter sp.]|uniref:hypothetical protein n=1 Tax=Luteibacter sp. TaxID=1886636 RepID=UPI0025B98519|nr:hypothetical protein [Luteibacter sp.]
MGYGEESILDVFGVNGWVWSVLGFDYFLIIAIQSRPVLPGAQYALFCDEAALSPASRSARRNR